MQKTMQKTINEMMLTVKLFQKDFDASRELIMQILQNNKVNTHTLEHIKAYNTLVAREMAQHEPNVIIENGLTSAAILANNILMQVNSGENQKYNHHSASFILPAPKINEMAKFTANMHKATKDIQNTFLRTSLFFGDQTTEDDRTYKPKPSRLLAITYEKQGNSQNAVNPLPKISSKVGDSRSY